MNGKNHEDPRSETSSSTLPSRTC